METVAESLRCTHWNTVNTVEPVTEQCDVVGQSSCTVGERLLIGSLIGIDCAS